MKIIKPLALLALIYCCLGPILLFAETNFMKASPMQIALPITLLAAFFFAYTLLSLTIFNHLKEKHSSKLTAFYLASKMIRLFFCIIILVAYGILHRAGMLTFAINLFAFYLVTVIYTSYYGIKEEHKKRNHNK